jgi:hypothetical protein
MLQEQYKLKEDSDIKFEEVKGEEKEGEIAKEIIKKIELKLLNRVIRKSPNRHKSRELEQLKVKGVKINPIIIIKT